MEKFTLLAMTFFCSVRQTSREQSSQDCECEHVGGGVRVEGDLGGGCWWCGGVGGVGELVV